MKLSIITINYNNKAGLIKTIESVMSQTWRDFEWIIIDGGSTDGSKDVIEELADNLDSNISYWCSEPDKGVYNAMNKGIVKASGEYLNFMNSGDCFYESDTLEKVFFVSHMADILYGDADFINEDGSFFMKMRLPDKITSSFYLNGNNISHQASFIKKSLFETKQYDESYKLAADGEFFFYHLLHNYIFQHINFVIIKSAPPGLSSNMKLATEEVKRFKVENIQRLSLLEKLTLKILHRIRTVVLKNV